MSNSDDPVSNSPTPSARPSRDAVERLVDAIERLDADGPWIVDALTEKVLSMPPAVRNGLTDEQRAALIDSGAITEEHLADGEAAVAAGGLQILMLRSWLTSVCGTMSVDEMSGYLGVDNEGLLEMVEQGKLLAVSIADRIRFPSWQCNIGSYVKLLPGLPEIIAALTEDESGWQNDAGFMSVPKASLIAEGRQTPVERLRDGHSPDRVVELIRKRDLW